MRPSPEMIPILIDAAKALKGSRRRLFMAKAVSAMGRGGQVWAEAHLHWNRETIRKGMHELRSGMTCVDAFHCRRRKPAEEHLPRLLDDIRAIADAHSQADPKFQTERLFTRISAAEVRRQLIATGGYTDAELPTQQTINTKLNMLGFRLTKVAKCRRASAHFLVDGKDVTESGRNPERGLVLRRQYEPIVGKSNKHGASKAVPKSLKTLELALARRDRSSEVL
jgi:hypothetical protein